MKKYFQLLPKYIRKYILSFLFFGYLVVSVLIKALTNLDITLACPIKYTTGIECLGCGLTLATVYMIKFQFIKAWKANPLVFIVVPLLLFILIRHWNGFVKSETNQHNKHKNP